MPIKIAATIEMPADYNKQIDCRRPPPPPQHDKSDSSSSSNGNTTAGDGSSSTQPTQDSTLPLTVTSSCPYGPRSRPWEPPSLFLTGERGGNKNDHHHHVRPPAFRRPLRSRGPGRHSTTSSSTSSTSSNSNNERLQPSKHKKINKKNAVSSHWVHATGSSFWQTQKQQQKIWSSIFEKSQRHHMKNFCGYGIKYYFTPKPWRKRLSSSSSSSSHGNQDSLYDYENANTTTTTTFMNGGYEGGTYVYGDNDDEEEEEDEGSFVDPLAAIIEKARYVTVRQRVRLVRFNLDRNQIMDDSSNVHQHKKDKDEGDNWDDDACRHSCTNHASRRRGGQNLPSILLNARGGKGGSFLSHSACASGSGSGSGSCTIKDYVESVMKVDGNGDEASIIPSSSLSCTFHQDPKISHQIQNIIDKGRYYHDRYQFSKAAKQYLDALKKLNRYSYPDQHPLQQCVQQAIQEIHYAHQHLEHSTNICKIGIHLEAKGQLVKAIKMYTVALRIRKECLGIQHPSIPMLLNLLGSVQVKRGQYEDAMEIFELALHDRTQKQQEQQHQQQQQQQEKDHGDIVAVGQFRNASASTLAVSMREIGSIHEHFGRLDKAMVMYHESLNCLMRNSRIVQMKECLDDGRNKEKRGNVHGARNLGRKNSSNVEDCSAGSESLEVCVVSSVSTAACPANDSSEEMEIYLQESLSYDSGHVMRNIANLGFFYDSFFQRQEIKAKRLALCVASILHCIARVHHKQREYSLAMSSYHASLRGMKIVHGEKHQTIAAILVNIGNLLKDMKDFDKAHDLFQSALKIESLRLGYSHTNVLVSMLKIASVENCRGRHDESIALYKEVIKIHKSRHQGNRSTANILLDAHCLLGDVYEKIGCLSDAIQCYKQALELTKKPVPSFQSDAGKLLHKLGILCSNNAQYKDADEYFMEALKFYESGSIMDERIMQVERDKADNRGKVVFVG